MYSRWSGSLIAALKYVHLSSLKMLIHEYVLALYQTYLQFNSSPTWDYKYREKKLWYLNALKMCV